MAMVRTRRLLGMAMTALCAGALAVRAPSADISAASTKSHHSTATTSPATVPAPSGQVPLQYAATYQRLSTQLNTYGAAVNAMPVYRSGGSSAPRFVAAAELLDANGNQQGKLLEPGAMSAVERELTALKNLGVRGVTIGIKLPLLLSRYTPLASKYANFYAAVAEQARARGFTIDVELGGLFCGTVFSTCSYAYPRTIAGWAKLTAEQARIVIARVHPNYLDILAEPNTEAELTSIGALGTLSGVVQFVTATLAQIGARGTTKIGAGAASWFPVSWDRAVSKTSVNVLIEHIYPLSPAIVQTITATAALAHQTHKPLVADEVWLYKSTPSLTGGVTASGDEAKSDAYSFFEPLDEKFLSITRQWSTKADVAFTSAFWSEQLFTYVVWTPQLEAGSPTQTLAVLNEQTVGAWGNGTYSASGLTWAGRVRKG